MGKISLLTITFHRKLTGMVGVRNRKEFSPKAKQQVAAQNKKYRDDYPAIASELLNNPTITPKTLAKAWGVKYTTLQQWRREFPELDFAIQTAMDQRNQHQVEDALLRAAIGYSYVEKHRVPDPNNPKRLIVIKEVEKHKPPDVAALIFWLKNRVPDRWVDKQIVEGGIAEELIQRLESAKARVIAMRDGQVPDDVIEVTPAKPKQVERSGEEGKGKGVDKPPLDGHDASSSGGLATGNATAPGAPYGFTKDGKPKLLPGRPRKVSSD